MNILIVMIPANNKYPPWTFYSGISKVQQMMKWVHQQASIPFDLEHLPHLTESQKQAYKEQVREREIELDKKRTQELNDMEKEEKAKEALLKRKNKINQQNNYDNNNNLVIDEQSIREDNDMNMKNRNKLSDLLYDNDEF